MQAIGWKRIETIPRNSNIQNLKTKALPNISTWVHCDAALGSEIDRSKALHKYIRTCTSNHSIILALSEIYGVMSGSLFTCRALECSSLLSELYSALAHFRRVRNPMAHYRLAWEPKATADTTCALAQTFCLQAWPSTKHPSTHQASGALVVAAGALPPVAAFASRGWNLQKQRSFEQSRPQAWA